MDSNLQNDLIILGLSEVTIAELSVNIVKNAFLKLALVRHPDKAGGSTAAFQELLNSYHTVLKHVKENLNDDNLDDDEQFIKDLFNQFNFPKENDNGFTILIENHLAGLWEEELSELYNDPDINTTNHGRQWKTTYKYEENSAKISITLWNTPKSNNQSKILIQGGRQSLNTIFVFIELSRMYTKVRRNSQSKLSLTLGVETSINCPQCDFAAKSTPDLDNHKKSIHVAFQVSCERCDFGTTTTESLTEHMKTHVQSIDETPADNLNKVKHCFQCKFTVTDVISFQNHIEQVHRLGCKKCEKRFENEEFLRNHIQLEHQISCDKCDKQFNEVESLSSHMKTEHQTVFNCDGCELKVQNEEDLRKHIIEKHNVGIESTCHKCEQNLKNIDLKLQCDHCEFFYHKKCTEFKSKPGQWNEPTNWKCEYCVNKKVTETPQTNANKLNPNVETFQTSNIAQPQPKMNNQPNYSGKHRKSKVIEDNPEIQILQTTVDTLKATIAKNDLEIKKLKESNDLKSKRIINLEFQVKEATNTIAKHQCSNVKEDAVIIEQSGSVTIDGFHQVKIATLENRTNTIEQNMMLLTSKLENLQFNFLANNRGSASEKQSEDQSKTPSVQKLYLCDLCDVQTKDIASLKKHRETKHKPDVSNKSKSPPQAKQDELACNQCSYSAIHLRDLKRHELQMHGTADEIFLCNVCDYSTQYESNLRKHVQFSHEQSSRYFVSSSRKRQTQTTKGHRNNQEGTTGGFSIEPLTCNSCDFQSKSIQELRNHKKQNVKTRQPFPGSQHVSRPPAFKGENKQGTNDTDLNCEKCKKTFNHKDMLNLHLEYFHSNTSESNQA